MTGCNVLYSPPAAQRSEPMSAAPPNAAEISEVIEGSQRELERCYLESLAVWPQFEGRVVLNVSIKPNGTVGDTAVAMHNSTVFDAAVGCCFAGVAQTWRFPAPADGKPLEIEYPFELLKDVLKIRFSASSVTAKPFQNQFPGTVVVAPPQPASGTELHSIW